MLVPTLKNVEDQLRRETRDHRFRVPKCVEVDGGIFEHLLSFVICHLKIKLKLKFN